MGFRLIKGFSEQAETRLVKHRPKQGYEHIAQIKALSFVQDELEALASANALQILNEHRYLSRWRLMDKEPELALFQGKVTKADYQPVPANASKSLEEDYAATGLSLSQHPISLLRDSGLIPKHLQASRLREAKHKQAVTVIGLVIGRQRLGTSKGVTFMTLEDDTGNINVIVWLATARQQKKHFLKSRIVQVRGILERGDGGVTHVIAGKIEDKSHLLEQLKSKSRDFH